MLERKPTLLAMFQETMAGYILELYHVRKGVYFGVGIQLLDRKDKDDEVVRVPVWVSDPSSTIVQVI